MNELRMYVERLFEGKVLTPENIELKEEIYGNLVARYEDYLAQGLSEAEALERTKASISSIDDVLSEAQPDADRASDDSESVSGKSESAASRPGTPVPPGTDTVAAGTPEPRKRKIWPFVVGGLVAVFVVLPLLGLGLASCAVNRAIDMADNATNKVIDKEGVHLNDDKGNSIDIDKHGLHLQSGNDAIYLDDDGSLRIEGKFADDLLKSMVNSDYTVVEPYVGTSLSDAAAVEKLIGSLPMAQWASGVDVTKGPGVLCVDYLAIDHTVDGDSVEAALAYNVAALLAAMPEVQEIRVNVSESDEPGDMDYYVFKRDSLEKLFGMKLDKAIVNAEGWQDLKANHLYKERFIDTVFESAEHSWY